MHLFINVFPWSLLKGYWPVGCVIADQGTWRPEMRKSTSVQWKHTNQTEVYKENCLLIVNHTNTILKVVSSFNARCKTWLFHIVMEDLSLTLKGTEIFQPLFSLGLWVHKSFKHSCEAHYQLPFYLSFSFLFEETRQLNWKGFTKRAQLEVVRGYGADF